MKYEVTVFFHKENLGDKSIAEYAEELAYEWNLVKGDTVSVVEKTKPYIHEAE